MYQKQNFVKGQKLKSDQLNHMESAAINLSIYEQAKAHKENLDKGVQK
jgi:hypothetical protein